MILCYDTVSPTFQGGVPADAQAILFYVDGLYANGQGARNRFPHLFQAGRAIGLTVLGRNAEGDDFEPGNWQGDAGHWVYTQLANDIWRPIVYADGSDMANKVFPSLEAMFGRPLAPPGPARRFRTILANPNGDPTIPSDHDGKQYWWGSIQGGGHVDMDISALRDDFFQHSPAPPPPTPKGTKMVSTYATADGRVGFVVETTAGEVLHIEQSAPNADWWRKKDGTPWWISLGKPSP